ncbi:MAG: hypothetical protein KGJ86_17770 [Chloroflexota bacterium]|nr:hypothetical protein [Chloroflexota bacterium]
MAKTVAVSPAGPAVAQQLLEGADPASLPLDDLLAGIESLGSVKTVEAADALVRISAPKAAAKAARRSLFKLQSQGVRPTAREDQAAEAPARGERAVRLLDAHVSSYDPRGSRAIFLLCEKPFTGLMSLFAVASDSEGLLDADFTTTTKKTYFARLQNFERQYEYVELVQAPPPYAAHLIERTAELNERSHRPVPQDYTMWKTVATGLPGWEGPPPVYQELQADEVRSRISADETKELALTEFAAWIYEEDQLKEHISRIETARGGPLVVSADAQRERQDAILNEATDAIFQTDELGRAKARLEETAYLLLKQGNRQAAERCLRAALSAEEQPPHAQPFLRQLVVKSLDLAMKGGLGETGEQGRAEELARTDSGIILPA